MARFKEFAGRHPVFFVLVVILAWFLVGALVAGLITLVLQTSLYDSVPQTLGTLAATLYVLLIAWRFGWLRAAGIAVVGNWQAWLVASLAFLYLVFAYSYAFFGDFRIDPGLLFSSAEVRSVVLRQIFVGPIEEILFRGIVLYALARKWGDTRQGLLATVLLSAFLFGVFHLPQALAGRSLGFTSVAVLEAFVSGIWWGAYVLIWRTIWPVSFIHAGSNMAVLIKSLAFPGIVLSIQGYTLAILLQIPLVLLGLYLLLRQGPRPVVPDIP
jgi:membrane protease YdiL (CAAX protease family)